MLHVWAQLFSSLFTDTVYPYVQCDLHNLNKVSQNGGEEKEKNSTEALQP